MTDHRSVLERTATCDLELTSDEYRLIADLLLEHLEVNNLRDERLNGLANRLYLLAVRAARPSTEQFIHGQSA